MPMLGGLRFLKISSSFSMRSALTCGRSLEPLAGLDVAIYLSGVVFVETVFAWPGIGELQEQAYNQLDRPLLMGTVIIAAVVVVAFNLVADVVRALVDPRARVEEAG
jgi:ABC-type dipeptide/oligopeptide/nickel transport system permease component